MRLVLGSVSVFERRGEIVKGCVYLLGAHLHVLHPSMQWEVRVQRPVHTLTCSMGFSLSLMVLGKTFSSQVGLSQMQGFGQDVSGPGTVSMPWMTPPSPLCPVSCHLTPITSFPSKGGPFLPLSGLIQEHMQWRCYGNRDSQCLFQATAFSLFHSELIHLN